MPGSLQVFDNKFLINYVSNTLKHLKKDYVDTEALLIEKSSDFLLQSTDVCSVSPFLLGLGKGWLEKVGEFWRI